MNQSFRLTQKLWRDPRYFLGLGFGSGLGPWIPGTWGTLAAVPLYWLVSCLSWPVYLLCLVIGFTLGVFICDHIAKALAVDDDPRIVWDEIIGYLMTLFLAPVDWRCMIVGFILFRMFDIWKPWPIRWFERRTPGGLGIMIDDAIAAIPAWCGVQAFVWWLH